MDVPVLLAPDALFGRLVDYCRSSRYPYPGIPTNAQSPAAACNERCPTTTRRRIICSSFLLGIRDFTLSSNRQKVWRDHCYLTAALPTLPTQPSHNDL